MLDAREPPIIKGFSAAYLALLGTLVLFVTLMGVAFIVLARQGQQGEQHFRYASEQRLLSRSVIAEAIEAARGKEAAFSRLKDSRDRFEQALQYEKVGNPAQGLPPVSGVAQTHVGTLETSWKPIRAEIDTILTAREPVVAVSNFQPLLEGSLNQMMVLSDEIAKSLANNRVDARQVYLATNQLQLLQRIDGDLRRMLTEGGISAAAAADRFNRNVGQFGRVLKGMREGDSRSGVERVTIPDGSSKLTDLLEIYKSLEAETGKIVERSPELVKVQNAAQSIISKGDVLLEASNALIEEYTSGTQTAVLFGVPISHRIVYLLGLVVVVVLLVLFYVQHRESRARLLESERRKFETEEQNRRNQDAILRLLDELGNLADGDLTVQASVTEDITGAIADSVNFAIEALRELVSTINTTSAQVTRAVQETRAIADRMAKSSEVQARQIENVSSTVGQMARAMDEASAKTASSAEVAEKSVGIAHEGGDRVRMTINGMNAIREHIQDTSKRIKRLGETCQEIGDIVGLINGIADQTNFLALNAAIQATAAGDAGRGFAVVADEVQRLAERTSNATKRIETLVKTIQADTNEVVISMEKSTYEVVGGAGLAEKAGEALEEIEKVSAKLAERIDEISKITGRVSEMAARMSTAMSSINEITNQTADSSVMTAAAIGALQHMAQQLNQSVSGFRLPG